MAKYHYKAMDENGAVSSGEVEVVDKEGLTQYLNTRGLYLVSFRKEGRGNIQLGLSNYRVTLRDTIVFSRQFSVMVSAGIGIDEAIRTISSFTTSKKLADVLLDIESDLSNGIPMSESMQKHTKVFKFFFISMMRVGEFSGELDRTLLQTANFYESEGKLRKRVVGALTYPAILVVLIIAVVFFLMTSIIPTFETMFATMKIELPPLTLALISVSNFLKSYGIFLLLGFVLIVLGITRWYRTSKGRYAIDEFILRIPAVKEVYIKTTTARFARSMDILLHSGITIMQSFDVIDSLISNVVIQKRFKDCKEGVSLGYSYHTSLEKMNFFPQILINMVAVGEKTGSLSEVFDKTSIFFDDEANEAIDKAIALVEPLILMIAGSVIVVIFLAIMLPMFEIMNGMQ